MKALLPYRWQQAIALWKLKRYQALSSRSEPLVLIILPEEFQSSKFRQALRAPAEHAGRRVHWVIMGAAQSDVVQLDHTLVNEVTWYGLPADKYVQMLREKRPEIVIDLHSDFSLPSAFLVAATGAPWRIGFYSEEAEPFFNVLIQAHQSAEKRIDLLWQIVGKILPDFYPNTPISLNH